MTSLNFVIEKILQHIIHTLTQGKFKLVLQFIVIHPMEELERGLTQIEFHTTK